MPVSNNSVTICHNPDPLRPSEPKTTLKVPWQCLYPFSIKNGALFGSSLLFLPINTTPSVLIPQHWWKFASNTVWMGSQVVSNPVYESIISMSERISAKSASGPTATCTDSRTSISCHVGMRCSGLQFPLSTCRMVCCCSRILVFILSLDSHQLCSQKHVNVNQAQAECFLAHVCFSSCAKTRQVQFAAFIL